MSIRVCIAAYALHNLQGGAYMWMFLNWALGLKSLGCRVVWLDQALSGMPLHRVRSEVAELKQRLEAYGLEDTLAVAYNTGTGSPIPESGCLDLDAATEADLLIDLGYTLHPDVIKRFRRSVFVDIDPGLTQIWVSLGQLELAQHDVYLSYGETVGQTSSRIPTCGLHWWYTPPPVFLPAWPIKHTLPGDSYTTVSNWWGDGDGDWIEIEGSLIDNSKRSAYLDLVELPSRTPVKLELALPLAATNDDANDRTLLQEHGWNVRHVSEISSTPEAHRRYVQQSRGEFSCMKRGYALLDTAWTSERTLNYLASGKPAVIQYTGRSRFLPDAEGLLRFRDLEEAAGCLSAVEEDYDYHSRAARALIEEHFNAIKVLPKVLEYVLP